ncbi:MAG: lipoxygenase family protein [Planctomycetales bacterium]
MSAFIPQKDPLSLPRRVELDVARKLYRYDYTHVSPLAMVDRVPLQDEFAHRWVVQVAEQVLLGLANMAEIEKAKDHREFHLAKHTLLGKLLRRAEAEFVSIKSLVDEALRFQSRLSENVERPQSLEDYAHLFRKIGLPPIAKDFQEDAVFAAMRVAGPNPVMLQRLKALDSRLAATDADLATVDPSDSLAAALAEGRLYLADYAILDGAELGDYPHGQKYVYAPLALFVVEKKSKRLMPVAIQCQQRAAADNPIFNPRDGYNWLIAKTIVEIADGNVHEAMTHLGRTHLLMEPFVVSTFRQLAPSHPLYILLKPHFEGTLAINDAAWKQLIASKGGVEKLMGGSLRTSRGAVVKAVQTAFDEAQLPKGLAARGVDDAGCLPEYPYRDDALLYWNAIHQWVEEYVGLYYISEADLAGDFELQAWYTELKAQDGGRINGLGNDAVLGSRSRLVDIVATVIYTSSVQHAAVNFPQFDLMSYVPNLPLAGYTPAPTAKQGATEADYLAMLPPLDMAELQLNLGFLLGGIHYTTLGQYGLLHFRDGRVKAPLAKFHKALQEIGTTISQRNQSRRPYEYLSPAGVPQSINI